MSEQRTECRRQSEGIRKYSFLFLVLMALLSSACQTPPTAAPVNVAAAMKSAAPELSLQKLENGRVGEQVKLSALRGKPVVLNFWATWCKPCKDELPVLDEAFRQYRVSRDLQVVGVNVQEIATPEAMQRYIAETGILYPVWLDSNGDANRMYNIKALPTTFFIDREGVIQQIRLGGPITREYLEKQLERIW